MPYMKNGKRDYKRENLEYNSSPEQKKNRAQRNAARATMAKAGKVSKGDGKDVAHRTAISRGGTNTLGNLFAESAGSNRSFAKDKNSKMTSERSKRER